MSVSKTILIGRLGDDPKIGTTNQGKLWAKFSVATSERWKDRSSGESKEHTDWHNVVVFVEPLAEFAEKYLKKGHQVYVEGQNKTRKWTDDKGSRHYSTEVVLNGFRSVLQSFEKREGTNSPDPDAYGNTKTQQPDNGRSTGRPQAGAGDAGMDDDIPFGPEWRL